MYDPELYRFAVDPCAPFPRIESDRLDGVEAVSGLAAVNFGAAQWLVGTCRFSNQEPASRPAVPVLAQWNIGIWNAHVLSGAGNAVSRLKIKARPENYRAIGRKTA